jgi:hypothetical protein
MTRHIVEVVKMSRLPDLQAFINGLVAEGMEDGCFLPKGPLCIEDAYRDGALFDHVRKCRLEIWLYVGCMDRKVVGAGAKFEFDCGREVATQSIPNRGRKFKGD